MENYKEEINKLQTQLDELKSKIEKPKFEAGKYARWKKHNPMYAATINDFALIKNVQWRSIYLVWITKTDQDNGKYEEEDLVLMTQKEVEEALTKEAVKRGFKKGVKYIWDNNNHTAKGELLMGWMDKPYCLYYKDSSEFIFNEGTWATILPSKKQMTILQIESELGYEIEIINK